MSKMWVKLAVVILVIGASFTLLSGQVGQVYAAGHWGHGGGYRGGWRYYGGGGYWFTPVYPVYPGYTYPAYSCPPGYVYNPNIYNPNMYPPYCQPITS